MLLLALLMALPATARPACHDSGAPQGQSVHMDHASAHATADHAPRTAHATAHDCLGCIPPDMMVGARVVRGVLPRGPATPAPVVAFAPGTATRPTPPPPKNA